MNEFTPDEKLMAESVNGTLIAAATKADGTIVIVLESGPKLTFTAEEVEKAKQKKADAAAAKAAAKAKAKAEAKAEAKTEPKHKS